MFRRLIAISALAFGCLWIGSICSVATETETAQVEQTDEQKTSRPRLTFNYLSSNHSDRLGPPTTVRRAKIPGGWLVTTNPNTHQGDQSIGITFVPDPDHVWNGGSLP